VAYGAVPAGEYLTLTPREVGALMEAIQERESRREHAEMFRTAFVVAEIRNTLRTKRSDKYWTPFDFVKKPDDVTVESREEFRGRLLAFATMHNARKRPD
jgi:hypothetical protein